MARRGRPAKLRPEPVEMTHEEMVAALGALVARAKPTNDVSPLLTGRRGRPSTRAHDAPKIAARYYQLTLAGKAPWQACRQIAAEFTRQRVLDPARTPYEGRLSVRYVLRQVRWWDALTLDWALDPDLAYEHHVIEQAEEEHEALQAAD